MSAIIEKCRLAVMKSDLRATLLETISQVSQTQENLLAALVRICEEHPDADGVRLFEECLDLAAKIRVQTRVLRSVLDQNIPVKERPNGPTPQ